MSNNKEQKLTQKEKQAYQTQKSLFLGVIGSGIPNAFSFVFPNLEIISILISYIIFPILAIFIGQDIFRHTAEKDILIRNRWFNNFLVAIYLIIALYFTVISIVYAFAKQECMKGEHGVNIRQCLQEAEKNRFINIR